MNQQLTKAERAENGRKIADQLKDWFKGRQIPSTIQMSKCMTILDSGKFIETNLSRLDAYRNDPFSKVFISSMRHLLDLKKHLEDGKTNV